MSVLTDAIASAVEETGSFMGQFSYKKQFDDKGNLVGQECLVSISDGQVSGSPEVGSEALVIEKKYAKLNTVQLKELVETKTIMGVGYSLWRFVTTTAQVKQ